MSARSWWRMLLIAAVLTSICGNVYHALLTAPSALRIGAALTAALPPLAVFGVAEGLMRSAGSGVRVVAYWVGVVAAAGIALIAFVLSFTALRSLAITLGQSPFVAAGIPLLADLLVAASSVMLLSFRSTNDVVPDELPLEPRHPAPEPGPTVKRAPGLEPHAEPAPEHQPEAQIEPAVPSLAREPEVRIAVPRAVTPITAARTSVDRSAHYLAVAEELVDNRGLTVRRGKELVAAVLRDRAAGMRNTEITTAHDIHHSVVKKIFDAADELPADGVLIAGHGSS